MKPLLITGWFVAIIITILVVMGSASLATVLHPSVDGWWATLAIIPLVLTLAFLPPLVQRPFIRRFTKGGEQMLADRRALGGARGSAHLLRGSASRPRRTTRAVRQSLS